MNKYNVRAIRKDLDSNVRNASWKKFRTTFTALQKNSVLCKAVVELKPKYPGSRHGNSASLLHSLCRASKSTPPVPADIIDAVASTVPSCLLLKNEYNRQIPLHVALSNGALLYIIESLLRNDIENKSLGIVDNNGDTPLLLAVRSSNEWLREEYVEVLSKCDKNKQSFLILSKKRRLLPLFYVAENELRITYRDEHDLPKYLQSVLLQTYHALLIKNHCHVMQTSNKAQFFLISSIAKLSLQDNVMTATTVAKTRAVLLNLTIVNPIIRIILYA